jgi:hypothetical protein
MGACPTIILPDIPLIPKAVARIWLSWAYRAPRFAWQESHVLPCLAVLEPIQLIFIKTQLTHRRSAPFDPEAAFLPQRASSAIGR